MPLFVGLWQVCVGDGTFMRYFPTHDPFWRFPTCRLEAVLGFRVYEVEAAPREPYLLVPSSTSLSLALLRTPRSSAAVGSRLARTSTVTMRLETAKDWMRHPLHSERVSTNVRLLQALNIAVQCSCHFGTVWPRHSSDFINTLASCFVSNKWQTG